MYRLNVISRSEAKPVFVAHNIFKPKYCEKRGERIRQIDTSQFDLRSQTSGIVMGSSLCALKQEGHSAINTSYDVVCIMSRFP